MNDIDVERLRSMGLTPEMAQRAATFAAAAVHPLVLMRVTEVHRETLCLHDGQREHGARALPTLLRRLAGDDTALAVGDWVLAAPDAHGQRWAHQRLPPRTHLARRDAHGHRHALVSNVDTALLVMGLDQDFNPRRLERFVALVQGTGVQPVVVLTKADTVADARALYVRQQAARGRLPADVDLLCVDARDADAALRLVPWMQAGQTLVLLGSSGAGKSTLTNTLLGQHAQDTGPVRAADHRGKHTTTVRSLFQLPGGGCVIDTPGLRALRPDADAATVGATFADIATWASHCRFRNCQHQGEPGCAVRESVDDDRLGNYQKLLREAERDSQGPLGRRQLLASWKARSRATRARLKAKRGEV